MRTAILSNGSPAMLSEGWPPPASPSWSTRCSRSRRSACSSPHPRSTARHAAARPAARRDRLPVVQWLGRARRGRVRLAQPSGSIAPARRRPPAGRAVAVIDDLAGLPTLLPARPTVWRPTAMTPSCRCASPTSPPPPTGCAGRRPRRRSRERRAERAGGRATAGQGRAPAAHRLVQVPRRLQRDPRRPAPAGGGGLLVGNHAQGVALAARLLGIPATIVMPADAPRHQARRHARARGRGGHLRPRAGGPRGDRREIAERTGAVLIRPTTIR